MPFHHPSASRAMSALSRVLWILLAGGLCVGGCASNDLELRFIADNESPVENSISLQNGTTGVSQSVTVIVRAGLVTAIGEDDEVPDVLILPSAMRLQATLRYRPDFIEFVRFEPGEFFENAFSGGAVNYSITPEMQGGVQTGRLLLDISIPQVLVGQRQGDIVKLVFAAVDSGFTGLHFVDGFGLLTNGAGQPLTGVSYFGGRATVVETTQ